jgi:hypothetical protein
MLIAPPLPAIAAPEPIDTDPVVPELEVPELNTNTPLTPLAPAFEVLMSMAPDVLELPTAPVIPIAPPEAVELAPAPIKIKLPSSVPSPTVMLKAPPLPSAAEEEPIDRNPEVPDVDDPELNTSTPLVPAIPEFDDLIVRAPLVVAVPWPATMPTAPPVWTVLSPDATVIKLPTPLMPVPTVMLIAPPLPPVAAPEPMETDPVVPELDVPELKTSTPLTPAAPALAERIVTAPLDVAMP